MPVVRLLVVAVAPAGAEISSAATPPPGGESIVTRQTVFSIPFQLQAPTGKPGDDPLEVQLFVSTDRGGNWHLYSKVLPTQKHFLFRASGDNEYWFIVRTIGRDGQMRPPWATVPELRVIVDTSPPVLQLKAARGAGGEITAQWEVTDFRLKADGVAILFRGDAMQPWQRVAIGPMNYQTNGTLQTGSVTWWPRSTAGSLQIRAEATDAAGNTAVSQAQVELNPAGAKVAQAAPDARPPRPATAATAAKPAAPPPPPETVRPTHADNDWHASPPGALAGAAAVPPTVNTVAAAPPGTAPPAAALPAAAPPAAALPAAALPAAAPAPAVPPAIVSPPVVASAAPAGPVVMPAIPASGPMLAPPALTATTASAPLVAQGTAAAPAAAPPAAAPAPGPTLQPPASAIQPSAPTASQPPPAVTPATPVSAAVVRPATDPRSAAAPGTPGGNPLRDAIPPAADAPPPKAVDGLSYGLHPRMVNSPVFELVYEVASVGAVGYNRVEVWGTRDGGQNWSTYGTTPLSHNPILIRVEQEGLYGFRLIPLPADKPGGQAPRSDETPDALVGVDLSRPEGRITSIRQGAGEQGNHAVITWEARDNLLAEKPISLFFSDAAKGPWVAIATNLPNTGRFDWAIDRHLPPQVFFRLEIRDEAGNLGVFEIPQGLVFAPFTPALHVRDVHPSGQAAARPFPQRR